MDIARIARLSALLALGLWLAKAVAIWAAGGLDRSALEGPLFLAGLLAYAAGAFTLGLLLLGDRSTFLRVGAAVLTLVAALLLISILQTVLRALIPESAGWVTEEAGLWASAAILVAVTQWRLAAPPRREQAAAA
jgi:hypothetical protein